MSLKQFSMIAILVMLLVMFLPNLIYATNVNMNLTNTAYSDENQIGSLNQTNTTTIPQTYTSSNGSVSSSLNSLPEANLGLTNILCIVLIVIGTLLVLLAIAILIRLKH